MIMSEGYQQKAYMDAVSVNCNIKFQNNVPTHVRTTVYDFAPFANSSSYCLTVNEEHEEICTGTKVFNGILYTNQTTKKRNFDNTAWTLKMDVKTSSNDVPRPLGSTIYLKASSNIL